MFYLSHGAGDDPDWFVVEPADHPVEQVKSLLGARRAVYRIDTGTDPETGRLAITKIRRVKAILPPPSPSGG